MSPFKYTIYLIMQPSLYQFFTWILTFISFYRITRVLYSVINPF